MNVLLKTVVFILLCILFFLLLKIWYLRRAADEIREGFARRLEQPDTNTLLDLSSRDPHMRELAASLNRQLRLLRSQRQKYLQGDRELKEAVTNISHDLRTPLTAICGYLELLEQEEKSENAARYTALIQNRAAALKRLTEELFRYSVLLSSPEEWKPEPVWVNQALEESIASFYGALTGRGITPVIRITPARVERLLNRELFSRILDNLLNNALKYSDGDLEITLSDDGEIRCSNTASRLDEVTVGRLFDRFYSVENAGGSTGLGLSIARLLTEQLGGSITAEYHAPRLTIRVKFPAQAAGSPAEHSHTGKR